jgi:hypothetical protein
MEQTKNEVFAVEVTYFTEARHDYLNDSVTDIKTTLFGEYKKAYDFALNLVLNQVAETRTLYYDVSHRISTQEEHDRFTKDGKLNMWCVDIGCDGYYPKKYISVKIQRMEVL